jgi:hypothetical protein
VDELHAVRLHQPELGVLAAARLGRLLGVPLPYAGEACGEPPGEVGVLADLQVVPQRHRTENDEGVDSEQAEPIAN